MKILREKFFGEVTYKTPSLNLGFKNYKYIKEYKGKERTELNDYIQNEKGGKNCWLKDYTRVAGATDDFSQFIPDLYYNKKDGKWYMFNSETDPIQKMKEEDVVTLVKSPKDWAESVEEEIKNYRKTKKFSKSDDLEQYVELDDKTMKHLTENQKQMLLEDERSKAGRNTRRIVKKHAEEGKREGGEKGAKKGKKIGTILGTIGGGLGAAALSHASSSAKNARRNATIGGIGGAVAGAGLGYLLGKSAGKAAGEAEGYASGAKKGAKIAKEEGHDATERTLRNARALDEYARKNKKDDHYEKDFRNTLAREKQEAEERAEKARRERLERERVEAEKRRARAEEEKARTDRDRYYDEHYGWGQYSRERSNNSGGSAYTQNNYYYR